MHNFFYSTLPCKPYVKRFLDLNFGEPADISSNKELQNLYRSCLKRPSRYDDNKYSETLQKYTEKTIILISEYDFYHYGWQLTKTDLVTFCGAIEKKAKQFMRFEVNRHFAVRGNLKTSIYHFQDLYEFPESVWTYDSIKKDFYRNATRYHIDFSKEIFKNLDLNSLKNLAEMGTLSQKAIKHYEHTLKTL